MTLRGLRARLTEPVDIASLAAFRVMFGCLLAGFIVRLWLKGFIGQAFAAPEFVFPFYGLGFLPAPGEAAYALYGCAVVLAALLSLGFYTRLSAALFGLVFSYLHFVDATYYLNHYYLVSLLSGLLALSPAGHVFSLDARRRERSAAMPAWLLFLFRFQVGAVYFFGGVAKLKYDWLFRGEPLHTWLLANGDVPVLGPLFMYRETAHVMSWLGALYDLSVPFLLSFARTRPLAYVAVVVFHLLTARLFHIGLFPYLMMSASLLFLAPDWPRKLLRLSAAPAATVPAPSRATLAFVLAYVCVQLLVPLRHYLYPGNVLWTEQGYRFAWHVMLIEKMGSLEYRVVDRRTGRTRTVFPGRHLSHAQVKAMATQPDMILVFARHLAEREAREGRDVAVYADSFVVLNGRPARRFVDPTVDLAREVDGFAPKAWILPGP